MVRLRHLIAGVTLAMALAAAPAHASWWTGGKERGHAASSGGGHAGLAAHGGSSSGGTAVPEPGNLGLFLTGVIGLAIGRRTSRIRKRKAD